MTVQAFALGLPARDEALRVAAALRALAAAAQASPAPVHLVLAVDRSRDATEAIAGALLGTLPPGTFASAAVLRCEHGSAGGARDAACRAALAAATAEGHRTEVTWIATTDADSTVAPDWLARHARYAACGAEGVAGLVELDHERLPDVVRARWRSYVEELGVGPGHPHVHGANLTLRADVWLAAGGFDHRLVGEDVELWRRARAAGAVLVGSHDIVVRTSARRHGRTPAGFAGVLRELAAHPRPAGVSPAATGPAAAARPAPAGT